MRFVRCYPLSYSATVVLFCVIEFTLRFLVCSTSNTLTMLRCLILSCLRRSLPFWESGCLRESFFTSVMGVNCWKATWTNVEMVPGPRRTDVNKSNYKAVPMKTSQQISKLSNVARLVGILLIHRFLERFLHARVIAEYKQALKPGANRVELMVRSAVLEICLDWFLYVCSRRALAVPSDLVVQDVRSR